MDDGISKPGFPELFSLFTIEMTIIHSNRKIYTLSLIIVFQLFIKFAVLYRTLMMLFFYHTNCIIRTIYRIKQVHSS